MDVISGVYKIINKVNNHFYVGSAVNIRQRWNQHKKDLRKNKHHNNILQNAWNRHGEGSFISEPIEFIGDLFELISKEQHYIDLLNPEYNINKVAGSRLGMKHSLETRKRMSKNHADFSDMNNPMYGRKGPNTGKTFSRQSREKMSVNHIGLFSGDSHPLFGRPVSEETKEKIRLSLLGKKRGLYKKREI